MFEAIAFYIFSVILIASGFLVIASRVPVHSVLFLILAFFNAAALFLLMGAEFLGLILLVVYVGAVAVLFLFVVMMLDVDLAEIRKGVLQYLPVGAMVGLILVLELGFVLFSWVVAPEAAANRAVPVAPITEVSNTEAIGRVLYTRYVYLFQASGLVLLLSMVGAIVLTHRQREGVKRQNVSRQVARTREEGVRLVKVKPGQGL
ncbi:MAG: NADH-quinone oxidoreductase subunit J [Alphaproteobacteria bacterium]|nr:NADH-quinone oxidoreductase subunit J [Alphaproteobacteria bacterium]